MSTLHANGPGEVPARIEALAALAGMPRRAAHAQLRQALQAVVHVVRREGVRRVEAVGVLLADDPEPGLIRVETALVLGPSGEVRGRGWCRLVELVPSLEAGPPW